MSDKNYGYHQGITDQDVVDFWDLPEELVGNEDIDFVASWEVHLQSMEFESDRSFEEQALKLMMDISPRVFSDCSFEFEEISSSYSVEEMTEACSTLHSKYMRTKGETK